MEDLKRKTFCLFWPLPGHLPHYLPQWRLQYILHHHQKTAVVTFVSSVKAATAGTTCMGKVDTQMLSGPHLPGLFVAYKCGAFYKKEEASKTSQAFRTVWSNHFLIKIDIIHLLILINPPTHLSIDLYIFKFIYVFFFFHSLNHSCMSLVIYSRG